MLIDIQEDYCAVAAGKKQSVIQGVIAKILGTHTNMYEACPIRPGEYYIRNFNFAIKHIPSMIPEGRYFMNITLNGRHSNSSTNGFIANARVYFHVTNYGTLDLNIG